VENKETIQKAKEGQTEDVNNLAMDLLQDYKLNFKRVFALLVIVLILWAATIGGFVWYLNQYDFVSSIESTAVYSIIDSSGNVISSDIPQDQLERILELISNGKDKSPKG
jgi:Tfp pilus assembly protein PilO